MRNARLITGRIMGVEREELPEMESGACDFSAFAITSVYNIPTRKSARAIQTTPGLGPSGCSHLSTLPSRPSTTPTTTTHPNMSSMGPPRPPVSSTTVTSSPARTAHSLALLTEYTHSLDSLPLDLSRNFADLRELDAVLSSSMTAVTNKVIQLTNLIENHPSKEERLHLLADIADEVSKLKPGADDKIRVACHAADALRGHQTHMTSLLDHIPEPEYGVMAGMLSRKTVYPHVAARSYVPSGMAGEGGRRRRGALLSSGTAMDATPNKRRRVAADDGDLNKSPTKPRAGEGSRARNGPRKKYVACYVVVCTHRIILPQSGSRPFPSRVHHVCSVAPPRICHSPANVASKHWKSLWECCHKC